VDGLYFVGAGTHPGAGVPGVLSSAKVLERIVPRPALGERSPLSHAGARLAV
jgi:phytoene desaturase